MAEEFELYTPECEDRVIVVYRGEEAYSLPYMNLRESEKVDVEHEGQPWGGFETEDRKRRYYDEPEPELQRFQEDEEEEPEEIEEEETEETEPVERSPYEAYWSPDQGSSKLAMFLAGTVLGLIAMYIMLFIFGPYVILVP